LLREVLDYLGRDARWTESKTIVSLGCGCTGDLTAFPGAVKIAIDPLLYVYQQLGMLVEDEVGSRTIHLALGAEDLPLLDGCADLIICRNALDHMPNPRRALQEMWRILHNEGALFVSVDIGGAPTPDEPTVFSVESLGDLLREYFDVVRLADNHPPHSGGRLCSVRVVAQKIPRATRFLDKEKILQAYEARLR
jgi:SAM-dependent methyltransferase